MICHYKAVIVLHCCPFLFTWSQNFYWILCTKAEKNKLRQFYNICVSTSSSACRAHARYGNRVTATIFFWTMDEVHLMLCQPTEFNFLKYVDGRNSSICATSLLVCQWTCDIISQKENGPIGTR